MADFNGDASNNSWTIVDPGTFSLDGKGGVDTLNLGTSLRSSYRVTQGAGGAVLVDSVSGASGALHATLFNVELLTFDSGRDVLDLRTFFGDATPPTLSITDTTAGTARGNVVYTLTFSEPVTNLALADVVVSGATVFFFGANGTPATTYSLIVTPAQGAEGSIGVTVKAAAVTDLSGNPLAQTSAAPQPFDTKAPVLASFSPANGATGVAANSNIVLNFSEAVQRSTGTVFVWNSFGELIVNLDTPSTAAVTVSGSQLTIDPTQNLPQGARVLVSFNNSVVTDLAGNVLPTQADRSFTVADDPNNPHHYGTAGNDLLSLPSGSRTAVGGPGIDTVALAANRAGYTLTANPAGFTLTGQTGQGTVGLDHIERLQFVDKKIALDLGGNAGSVAKILGAVFGPDLVHNAAFVGIGLNIIDGGMSYPDLIQLALDFHLGANASNTLVVQTLYTNVVGFAPSPEALASFVALLDNHSFTPASLGVLAADHELNLAHIDLVGLMQTGIEFS